MTTSNIILYLVGGLLVLALLYTIGQYLYVNYKLEKPSYQVITEEREYEIRAYESYITASAFVPNDEQALNNGFRLVADYIFGNNTKSGEPEAIAMTIPVIDTVEALNETIAMTTPVVDQVASDQRKISFVLPSEYTLETLPTPNNPEIVLEEEPSQTWAVTKYSWFTNREKKDEKYKEFLEIIEADGVAHTGEWKAASYDPPLTLPFLRTHEIWIRVQK